MGLCRGTSSSLTGAPAGAFRHPSSTNIRGHSMTFARLNTFALALVAMLAIGFTSTARADEGYVRIQFLKAGWVIGGTVGSGTLTFKGRTYRLAIGGLSYGLTFGGAVTNLRGRVCNIYSRARCRRRLWRGCRRRRGDPRAAGGDPHQPARRGDGARRRPDRADGEPGSERDGGELEVGAAPSRHFGRAKARSASSPTKARPSTTSKGSRKAALFNSITTEMRARVLR